MINPIAVAVAVLLGKLIADSRKKDDAEPAEENVRGGAVGAGESSPVSTGDQRRPRAYREPPDVETDPAEPEPPTVQTGQSAEQPQLSSGGQSDEPTAPDTEQTEEEKDGTQQAD